MPAPVGKPFVSAKAAEGVNDTLEDAELRASSPADRREAEPGPVSEPVADAAETDEGREFPETEGHTLLRPPVVLGFGLAAPLRASDAGLGEAGESGVGPALPLDAVGCMGALPHRPRWLGFTRGLVGGGAEPVADAAETDEGRELPEAEGPTLLRPPVVLGFGLAALLRASDAGLGEAGESGVGPALPLDAVGCIGALPHRPRWLEFTRGLVGGGAPRLLREAALLVLVVCDIATLALPSSSSSSPSDPAVEFFHAARAELTVDSVSARSNFVGIVQTTSSGSGGALGPDAGRESGVS